MFEFEEVESWLNHCEKIAEENGLIRYIQIVQRERSQCHQYKRKIAAILEIDREISPQMRYELARDYLKKAEDKSKEITS